MLASAEHGPLDEDRVDIRAFLNGEREAFDRLVMRHADRTLNLCIRLLGDREEAEDCAQEVFVKVFQNVKNFRLESRFSTWIYAIAVNTCKNRRKSAEFRFWERILRLGRNSEENEEGVILDTEDPSPSPLKLLTNGEQERLLQKAMDALSHDHRMVLVLRYVEGLAYEDICHITGYNPGTLKSKLARARKQLHHKIMSL